MTRARLNKTIWPDLRGKAAWKRRAQIGLMFRWTTPSGEDRAGRLCNSLLGNFDSDTALDEAFSDGAAGETCDVMNVELAHEMLPMFVHRFEAHA